AGFDSGSPTVRRDSRALGQVSGRTPDPALHPARPAPSELPPSIPTEPAVPDNVRATESWPAEEESQAGRSEEVAVPSFLDEERKPSTGTGAVEVPPVFEDRPARRGNDELDLPDFLKNPQ